MQGRDMTSLKLKHHYSKGMYLIILKNMHVKKKREKKLYAMTFLKIDIKMIFFAKFITYNILNKTKYK